jgi:hypothetical protein
LVNQLYAYSDTDLVRATRILKKLIEADNENWHIFSWKAPAKELLMKALKKGGEAKQIAEESVDMLGRRGLLEFGELLNVQKS